MGNICSNYLNATTGREEEMHLLASLIREKFQVNDCEYTNETCIEMWFDSDNRFPQNIFREITESINSDGLYIRVSSDEQASEYLEQSIFRDGSWNFDNIQSVLDQIDSLIFDGVKNIKRHLTKHGDITGLMEESSTPPTYYITCEGIPKRSYYKEIKLAQNGKLSVLLLDDIVFDEDDLTRDNVIEILSIIKEKIMQKDNNLISPIHLDFD